MRREAIAIGLAMILAGPYSCLAQQAGYAEGGRDGAAATQVSAIPLTPDMIKALGKRLGDNRRAQEEVTTQFAAPNSRRVNVSFTPGQTTNIIQLVKGYPTAVSFFDLTGEPWPIEWDTNSNPAGVAGGCQLQLQSERGRPGRRGGRILRLHAGQGQQCPRDHANVAAAARRLIGDAAGRAEADQLPLGRRRRTL